MLYKNIVVPYDGSDHAKHALETALKLASDDPEAKVHVLTAAEMAEPEGSNGGTFEVAARMAQIPLPTKVDIAKMSAEFVAEKKETLEKEVAPLVGDAKNVDYTVALGKAQNEIVDFIETNGCDLVVMGCRGLNALRGMVGSVSFAVLRSVDIPVFVVK